MTRLSDFFFFFCFTYIYISFADLEKLECPQKFTVDFSYYCSFFLFLAIVEFELRASLLLHRHSIIWATLPTLVLKLCYKFCKIKDYFLYSCDWAQGLAHSKPSINTGCCVSFFYSPVRAFANSPFCDCQQDLWFYCRTLAGFKTL
jgi:hypothetical protein